VYILISGRVTSFIVKLVHREAYEAAVAHRID
jgi:hypothetical protein